MLEVSNLPDLALRAREASFDLATTPSDLKNSVLLDLAARLQKRKTEVLAANRDDMDEARTRGMAPHLLDRLLLTEDRLDAMANDVRHVANLPDPVGEEFDANVLPNGLELRRRRVPLGLIGVVYESRPNVTIDVSALCIKSGNAVILRGGKEALRSNRALAELVREALAANHISAEAVQFVDDPDRAQVLELIRMRGVIDLVVPRGGSELIEFVRENSSVPVLAGGVGVCHTYVHEDAELDKALEIVHNAKTRRPSVCNALDTVLVHHSVALSFLPALAERWTAIPVEMRCCPESLAILQTLGPEGPFLPAAPDDFGREFLSLIAAIKVVDTLDEAIDHIRTFGSGHSEAIVTEGYTSSREFLDRVDAAAVFVNASTAFTDGAEFGLGSEIGISTQKYHARGPIGLRELTSYKWVVLGDGQVRP